MDNPGEPLRSMTSPFRNWAVEYPIRPEWALPSWPHAIHTDSCLSEGKAKVVIIPPNLTCPLLKRTNHAYTFIFSIEHTFQNFIFLACYNPQFRLIFNFSSLTLYCRQHLDDGPRTSREIKSIFFIRIFVLTFNVELQRVSN